MMNYLNNSKHFLSIKFSLLKTDSYSFSQQHAHNRAKKHRSIINKSTTNHRQEQEVGNVFDKVLSIYIVTLLV